jgi:hypothetical protein
MAAIVLPEDGSCPDTIHSPVLLMDQLARKANRLPTTVQTKRTAKSISRACLARTRRARDILDRGLAPLSSVKVNRHKHVINLMVAQNPLVNRSSRKPTRRLERRVTKGDL